MRHKLIVVGLATMWAIATVARYAIYYTVLLIALGADHDA